MAAGCRGGWRTVKGLVANPVPACLKDKLPDNIIVCTTRGAGIKSLSGRDLDGGILFCAQNEVLVRYVESTEVAMEDIR